MNTTNKPGRPAFVLTYPNGPFTLNQLFDLNHVSRRGRGKGKVCKLTIIKHIEKALNRKLVKRMKETVKTGGVGKPPYQYTLTSKGQAKLVGATPVETPVPVAETPIPVVEAPVAETPVVVAEAVVA